MKLWLAMLRLLRAPSLILAELLALAVACALGAAIPQLESATSEELARLQDAPPFAQALVKSLSLDQVFSSVWFLAITALTFASLVIVVIEQYRRVRSLWSQTLTRAHFAGAPFRTEFKRPLTLEQRQTALPRETRVWSERRIGLTGSLVFHSGLLFVMLAGSLRALFATGAAVDVLEGETVAPNAAAWGAQFPGVLGKSFQLEKPVTLVAVNSRLYANRELRELSLRMAQAGGEVELAINHELRLAGGRIFLGHDFGPAALLEWNKPDREPLRKAAMLTEKSGAYGIASDGPGGFRAFLRAEVAQDGSHPQQLEVRVMRAQALIAVDQLRVGEALRLPDGTTLKLCGTPFWVRLRGSHDPSLPLIFIGFALILIGSIITFSFVKLDACVVVTPAGDHETVFIALKPQRFAPLFAERYARLLREHGFPA